MFTAYEETSRSYFIYHKSIVSLDIGFKMNQSLLVRLHKPFTARKAQQENNYIFTRELVAR